MILSITTLHSVRESDPGIWDLLGNNKPFTSYRWYRFLEKVLSKDKPIYFIVNQGDQPVARATFWIKHEDTLPVHSPVIRKGINAYFRRWPLMICQSPLSNSSGLILPDSRKQMEIFNLIMNEAVRQMQANKASFLVFDYLTQQEVHENTFGNRLNALALPEQGTYLKIEWQDFESYLKHLSKNERKSYKRSLRRVNDVGVEIRAQDQADSVDEALRLIVEHDKRYKTPTIPWARKMLENMAMVDSVWLGAYIENKLVGCELLLGDNGSWVSTALGRDYTYPYVYFVLGYESIRFTIQNGGKYLRWGTGTYEYKKRLGFQLENNHYVSFMARNKLVNKIFRKVALKLVEI